MHIPDGFLSPPVAAATWAVAATGMAVALRAERRERPSVPSGILGAVAAFLFAAQLVNVPVAAGTSGHLVGATLAAVMLGPWRAVVILGIVLFVQALLFQDGGIAALGANAIDMALAGSLTGFGVASLVARLIRGPRGCAAGSVIGAFAATLAAATLTAIWLASSGLYPLMAILPLMLLTHTAIGVLEAGLTGAVVVTLLRWRPDLVRGLGGGEDPHPAPVAASLGLLGGALAVAALIAPFASALPDGLEWTITRLGLSAPARPAFTAPFPDYSFPMPVSAGVASALAGVVGTLVVAAIAWAIGRRFSSANDAVHR